MNPNDAPLERSAQAQNEPQSSVPLGRWLSVADFAAARGCSIRTVKRYIENGEVETRKDGARRFVRPLEEGTQSDTEGTQRKGHTPASVSLSTPLHAQFEGHKGHGEGTQSDTEGTQPVSLREAQLRDELARERELSGFLRGLVEGHARAEAELRAALREALKITPRQLPPSESATIDLGPKNGQQRPQSANTLGPSNGARIEMRDTRTPLSYGDIADIIEQELNQ